MGLLGYNAILWTRWALIAIGLFVSYTILKITYRLFFHPLAKFPGPMLAAATHKYEFYWDGVKDGQYSNHIADLHKIHGMRNAVGILSEMECTKTWTTGPIIRINPDELHCNDPGFIDQVYASGRRRTHKTAKYSNSQGFLLVFAISSTIAN